MHKIHTPSFSFLFLVACLALSSHAMRLFGVRFDQSDTEDEDYGNSIVHKSIERNPEFFQMIDLAGASFKEMLATPFIAYPPRERVNLELIYNLQSNHYENQSVASTEKLFGQGYSKTKALIEKLEESNSP